MNSERRANVPAPDTTGGPQLTTRRALLAAGGAVALGSLAGCTSLDGLADRAGEQVVGTAGALPAAFYAGGDIDDETAYKSGPVDVRFVPPTLQADSQRIDIDGWSTTTTTKAKDLNSSRSNKPSTIWPGPDDDVDDDDDAGTLTRVLDIERALLVYAEAAIEAVDDRSSDEARGALDAFINATTKVRTALENCSSETCTTVSENADVRKGLAEDANDAVDAGEWDSARRSMQQARRIVQGDIDRIFDDLDSDGDGISDGLESLYNYLDGEPTIGEHFVVSLPDARVRGGGPALADELTPQRVLDYFTGERNADGCADSDRAVAVHEDLSCRDVLTATLTAQATGRGIDKKDLRRGVAAFETSGGVILTGATPEADVAAPMLRVAPDNTVSAVESLDSWGEEWSSDEATVSAALALPVVATPADCPCPMPALFHVRRIRHDDQLLFVGGWHLDDGALYEHSATLLAADGPNLVAGVTRSDIEDGGVDLQSLVRAQRKAPRKKPGRTTYANITLSRGYDSNDDALPPGAHGVCRDDGELYCWGVQSREALAVHDTGGCPGRDGDAPAWSVVTALDAPVLHLVGAADASNDVKFKAGAELSKAVN